MKLSNDKNNQDKEQLKNTQITSMKIYRGKNK